MYLQKIITKIKDATKQLWPCMPPDVDLTITEPSVVKRIKEMYMQATSENSSLKNTVYDHLLSDFLNMHIIYTVKCDIEPLLELINKECCADIDIEEMLMQYHDFETNDRIFKFHVIEENYDETFIILNREHVMHKLCHQFLAKQASYYRNEDEKPSFIDNAAIRLILTYVYDEDLLVD